ncbi:MAG TPA: EAL domain-containing protein [Acidimicrobiales bacterium]|jgi:diguanylate cyclase (GGDEF)-like protein/PAS domain S-box-containing protein|nr:EAL domain-containing protein [Acidimicrobiales bacterium]
MPWRWDDARASRQVARQLVPLAVFLVVAAAVVGVGLLRNRADEGRTGELLLTRIDALAQQQHSQLGRAVTGPAMPAGLADDITVTRSALRAAVDNVPPRAETERVVRAASRFDASVEAVLGLLDEHGAAAARQVVRDETGPAITNLHQAVTQLRTAEAARADRLARTSDIASLLLLLVAGFIVWLLLRRAERARRAAHQAETTAASQRRFEALVQNSSDVITVCSVEGRILFQTPSVSEVFGYEPNELIGTDINKLVHPDDLRPVQKSLLRTAGDDAVSDRVDCRVRHADGSWRYTETSVSARLDDPLVGGFILNTRDITERKELEDELTHQAFHDSLTGLANRALFRDRIQHALNRQRRQRRPLAILLFDLDGFKTLNDSLGHAFGDRLLAAVGERLKNLLRPSDTACRLGGDEFAVLVEDLTGGIDATVVAGRILDAIRQPFDVDGKEVVTAASLGIAIAGSFAESPDDLLRNADVAMYTAKGRGRGRYELFQPSMHKAMLDRLDLEADLRRAVERGEFVLHYQPTVALATGRISGMEALVRWNSPERGMVPPGMFIPVAEDTGLIVPLGAWVLEEACRQTVAWAHEFGPDAPTTISINVSARQLQDDALVPAFAEILERTGINPSNVVLEITESAVMSDAEAMVARLHQLKNLGVRLAIDDFGTGYSSMSYLCSFPIDILKIDRSFVSGVPNEPQKVGIVRTIVELGHILELQTVAEGIELDEELEQLRALDCDLGQGYWFAKPLPVDAVVDLLIDQAAKRRRGELAVFTAAG